MAAMSTSSYTTSRAHDNHRLVSTTSSSLSMTRHSHTSMSTYILSRLRLLYRIHHSISPRTCDLHRIAIILSRTLEYGVVC